MAKVHVTRKMTLLFQHLGLSYMEGYMTNDRILCSFRRKKEIEYTASNKFDDLTKFDLTVKYHVFMTRGEVDDNGGYLDYF